MVISRSKRRSPPYQLTRADLLILVEAGKTSTQAAEITGWGRDYLARLAKKAGLRFRHPKQPGRPTGELHAEILSLWHAGVSNRIIAKRLGCNRLLVGNHIYRAKQKGEIDGRRGSYLAAAE